MVDIEAILPLDPGMTEEEIDNVLDRPNYIARVVAGGAVAASVSVASYKIWRRYHPYVGIDND